MKSVLLIIPLLLMPLAQVWANQLDSLLKILDATIINRPLYAKQKELEIDSIKGELKLATTQEQEYLIYASLTFEYLHYNMDSALYMSRERLKAAEAMRNPEDVASSNAHIAEVLGGMGMYKEALDMMDKIDHQKLDKQLQSYYFHVLHATYQKMADNTLSPEMAAQYEHRIWQYKDSLLQKNEPGSLGYQYIKCSQLEHQGKYNEALALLLPCYQQYINNNNVLGTLAYELSVIYRLKGDKEQEKYYLAISAIADLRVAVKEYIALRKLASILYNEGEIDRAYSYIKCSLEDATFCKARFRTLEISEMLPIISDAYDRKLQQEHDSLISYLALISILSIGLLIGVLYIFIQMKRLAAARRYIGRLYHEMKQMNEDLNELNMKLSESNMVKETYIGSIFNLCSSYISKMEAYRVNVNRKLKSGLLDEAAKMTSSTALVADELKEFFRSFDAIFLSIYPNFVEQFNALLIEEERIVPKGEDILTPELRVFALIRLGITDSSKIANFLHYSSQTVYNYKLKVHNKLSVSKDDFAKALQQIGS